MMVYFLCLFVVQFPLVLSQILSAVGFRSASSLLQPEKMINIILPIN